MSNLNSLRSNHPLIRERRLFRIGGVLLGTSLLLSNGFTYYTQDKHLLEITDEEKRAEQAAREVDRWKSFQWYRKMVLGIVVGGNYLASLKHDTRTAVTDVMEGETE